MPADSMRLALLLGLLARCTSVLPSEEGKDLDITVEAVQPDAWMDTLFPYWEGPIRITGSHGGRGYLEMTGYN